MAVHYLDFERPIVELENKIAELKQLGGAQLGMEIQRLERKARQLQREVTNVFADFEIATLDDGTEIASSPFVTEG